MTIKEGPGGVGTKIIATRYPVVSGLEAGTTKTEGRQINLVEKVNLVPKRNSVGL